MRIALAALILCLAATFGCRAQQAPAEHRTGAALTPSTSPQDSLNVVLTNQVSHVDASILGTDVPLNVAIAGTVDGGSPSGALVMNDAGNPVPVDPYAGEALNVLVVQPVPATQNILIDAGTRCLRDITFVNEGTIGGYGQVFCGQYTPDAGGTAAAATKPDLQVKCPAGTICSQDLKAPLCCTGAVWYSGVDAGFLLTTSAPVLTLQEAVIR